MLKFWKTTERIWQQVGKGMGPFSYGERRHRSHLAKVGKLPASCKKPPYFPGLGHTSCPTEGRSSMPPWTSTALGSLTPALRPAWRSSGSSSLYFLLQGLQVLSPARALPGYSDHMFLSFSQLIIYSETVALSVIDTTAPPASLTQVL